MRVDLDRRELFNGLGDGLSRAFELTLTPAIFGALGHVADRAAGTTPLLTIILFLFAMTGAVYMAWFRYDQEMRRHEERRLAARAGRAA